MDEINRFKLEDDVFIDTKSTAEDGGKQTYWVIEYKQRQQLLNCVNELASENERLKEECMRAIGKIPVLEVTKDITALINLMNKHGLTWEFVYDTIYEKVRDFDD